MASWKASTAPRCGPTSRSCSGRPRPRPSAIDKARLTPDPALTGRVAAEVARLAGDGGRIGLAVSGGADSLALLLLGAAALPRRVEAATVDHGFHAQGREWAEKVGAVCAALGVPHSVLTVEWDAPVANRQAEARAARYRLLAGWAEARGLAAIATAHQLDDQAETLLMRLGRGAGVGGLAGVRESRMEGGVRVIRPLLGWRRGELAGVVAQAGLAPVDDPANRDPAHDRTRARAFLGGGDWPSRARVAASAVLLARADEAIEWSVARLLATGREIDGAFEFEPGEAPQELRFRAVAAVVQRVGAASERPRGDVVARAVAMLDRGDVASLAGVVIRPLGTRWRFDRAPARRN